MHKAKLRARCYGYSVGSSVADLAFRGPPNGDAVKRYAITWLAVLTG